jgi:D-alanyl-D-alanine carboxypeptidase
MTMRRAFLVTALIWLACAGLVYLWPALACAQDSTTHKPTGRYASIIVDTDNLDILHARQIDELRYPASLTKVMTLYLAFDALDAGQLRLEEKIKVSSTAARTPPVDIGLRAGETVSVDTLLQAIAVRSANDAAVVLAERLGGSEAGFADLMTAKARSLGMSQTTFKTANGLPHPEQLTTARDMAKLANAVLVNHRRHYHYFGLKTFTFNGRTYRNTNKLLRDREDVDGFKTGYTRDSGYNLIVSAQQNGRRLIAVVLGGASGASRNSHMSDLVDRGFDVMGVKPQNIIIAKATETVPARSTTQNNKSTPPTILRLRGQNEPILLPASTKIEGQTLRLPSGNWSVQLGLFNQEVDASAHLDSLALLPDLAAATPVLIPRGSGFAARMSGLSAQSARAACKALVKTRHGCLIIGPSS